MFVKKIEHTDERNNEDFFWDNYDWHGSFWWIEQAS
jgi:hypothetical protein